MPSNLIEHKNSYNKLFIIAKCPLCEMLHRVKINWIGNGRPRIYCSRCFINLKQSNVSED